MELGFDLALRTKLDTIAALLGGAVVSQKATGSIVGSGSFATLVGYKQLLGPGFILLSNPGGDDADFEILFSTEITGAVPIIVPTVTPSAAGTVTVPAGLTLPFTLPSSSGCPPFLRIRARVLGSGTPTLTAQVWTA